MKTIVLTQGKIAFVDDEDFERINKYKWCAHYDKRCNRWDAVCSGKGSSGKGKIIYMHREIKNAPDGMDVDHRNHNGLDNQKLNLRVCTVIQNLQNHKIYSTNTTGVTGVSWAKGRKRWRVTIGINNKQISIGYFKRKKTP
jgi:hypothetical protein